MSDLFAEVPFNGYTFSDSTGATAPANPPGIAVGAVERDEATGYFYRFIQVALSLVGSAFAAGQVIISTTDATFKGTNDYDGGFDATYPPVLGIATSACPTSTSTLTYYCWVLIRGYYAAVLTNGDDDIAAGNLLIPAASDGVCDSLPGTATNTADGVLATIFGRAAAADVDSANTVAAFVDVRF